jgi:c-di-GMP-binding flagellar brake protein YcgR
MEERRAARRYQVALRVEIGIAGREPIFGTTRDLSTHGFYCQIGQGISVGTKFKFSITLAEKVTESMQGFVSGQAKVVRVEESPEESLGRVGVDAEIESFGLGKAVAHRIF